MKYCVPYYSTFRYPNLIDEIILEYKQHNDNIIEFVTNNYSQKQRIIVDVAGRTKEMEDIIPILRKLYQAHENMSVRIPLYAQDFENNKFSYEYIHEAGMSFFFSDFCRTKDEVYAFIQRGVTDVYIVEGLAFDIKEVGEYCHDNDINVRIIPNMAQYPLNQKDVIPAAYKFFVRPEDVDVYENYVDIMELAGPADRMSVLFNIYKSKQWLGDLKELILGLDDSFINTGMVPYFGTQRLNCKHKCMLEQCNLCSEMQKIAKQFDDTNVTITRERDTEWKNELKIDEETLHDEEEAIAESAAEVSPE